MRLGTSKSARLLRLTLAFVVQAAWTAPPAALAQPPAIQPAPGAAARPNDSEERARRVDRAERLLNALEAADREMARDTFEPQATIEKVGRDPEKLFEWVRDSTCLVPYQGSLRGPVGVLMDRQGNSLDRSLLLAELLRLAGHTVRLARGVLSAEQVRQAIERAKPVKAADDPEAESKRRQEQWVRYEQVFGVEAKSLRQALEKSALAAESRAEDAAQRVAEQTTLLADAVGAPAAAPDPNATVAIADHWWVQCQHKSIWTDYDVLLPAGHPGNALATVKQTFAPGKNGTFDLGAALVHQVVVRVIIEQRSAGGLKEQAVLTHVLRPAEALGQDVVFGHYPLRWPEKLDLLSDPDPAGRLTAAALQQHEWLPFLQVGRTTIASSTFTDTGQVNDKPQLDPAGKVGAPVRGAFGDLSGALDESGAQPQKQDQQLTAEWLEYEIRSPGRPIQTIRRQMFDLIGPAARAARQTPLPDGRATLQRALALLGHTRILLLPCQLSQAYVEHLCAQRALDSRQVILNLLRAERPSMPQEPVFLPAQLYALALARGQWARTRGEVFLDQPNILSFRSCLRAGAQGEPIACEAFDIVSNGMGVRPGADAFKARLEQGVLDTNAEAILTQGGDRVPNAADLLAALAEKGPGWTVLREANDPNWNRLDLSPDARSRIAADLAAGCAVVV
ncbi:MAG TPA: hypothetical protein VM389_06430, partial [Phycisphaerae bacterium]|nr:hypothetical protein [Phycisphaerae bacterium]